MMQWWNKMKQAILGLPVSNFQRFYYNIIEENIYSGFVLPHLEYCAHCSGIVSMDFGWQGDTWGSSEESCWNDDQPSGQDLPGISGQ